MTIFFHIGLPKTATTFWQYSVFKKIENMTVVHRGRGESAVRFGKDMTRYLHQPERRKEVPPLEDLQAFLRGQAGRQDLLVSNENISMSSQGFWQGSGASPEQVADFLLDMAKSLEADRVGIIIGTRRPDTWLASRYAESSKAFKKFGQHDFERRMIRLAQAGELQGAEKWLDQTYIRRLFQERFGEENIHFPRMEDLETEPEETILEMGRFLGGRDFGYIVSDLREASELTTKRNSLSDESGSWKLRSDGTPLHFPLALKTALLKRFDTEIRSSDTPSLNESK